MGMKPAKHSGVVFSALRCHSLRDRSATRSGSLYARSGCTHVAGSRNDRSAATCNPRFTAFDLGDSFATLPDTLFLGPIRHRLRKLNLEALPDSRTVVQTTF